MRHTILTIVASIGLLSSEAPAQSNIDSTNKHAWSENVGWTNWRDADGSNAGVLVSGTFMGGFIWSENIGYINVGNGGGPYANDPGDSSTFGVNIESNGDLHGLAWGEHIGWVNFDGGAMATPAQPARIECDGRLTGYVWGENIAWINLDDLTPGKFVSVDAAFVPIDCDMNHDAVVNGLDIQLFTDFLLMNSVPDWRDVCSGDVEAVPDQVINLGDVADFVACLLA